MIHQLNPTPDLPDGFTEYRVIGPPGCGKTTWLRRQVELAVEKGELVLIGSLTRAAAAEIVGLRPPIPRENVGTLHSHCYRSLGNPPIAQAAEHIETWNELYPFYAMTPAGAGDDFTNPVSGDEYGVAGRRPGDRLMSQYEVHRARMTTHTMPYRLSNFAKLWERWKREEGLLDFTDLIEVCLRDVPSAPGNPTVLFIDEAQDLDRVEIALIRKWGLQAGCLVLVGDPEQAIYTWRGADPQAFTDPPVPPDCLRTLSQSFRVPRQVHARAVRWIGGLPYREPVAYDPRPEEGEVRISGASYANPGSAIDDAKNYLTHGKTVMFLTSCAYMLNPLLTKLRERGIPFHNCYRVTNHAWNPLVQRGNAPSMAQRIQAYLRFSQRGAWTAREIRLWTSALELEGILRQGAEGLVQGLVDDEPIGISWDMMCEMFPATTIDAGLCGDLGWFSQHLKSGRRPSARYPLAIAMQEGPEKLQEPPNLTVGTIHSVKGGEADVVFLFPDLSRSAMRHWTAGYLAQAPIYKQFYVGMTRARESLVLCSPAGRHTVRL